MTIPCPEPDQLRALLGRDLPIADQPDLAEHIEDCLFLYNAFRGQTISKENNNGWAFRVRLY